MLDDNVLGYSGWRDIFKELQATGKAFQLKQGLDERILTNKKCEVLKDSKYKGDYAFAFDNIADKDLIIQKAELLRKHIKTKGQNIKFYVLCGFDRNNKYDSAFWEQDIKDTFERIFILSKYNFKSYIMRYEKYKTSSFYVTYVNLACWCNTPSLFMNFSYRQFCEKDDLRKSEGKGLSAAWKYFKQIDNNKFSQYLDIVPENLKIDY